MKTTECVVCTKEVEQLETFNGEMMCKGCYDDPKNHVFTDDETGEE